MRLPGPCASVGMDAIASCAQPSCTSDSATSPCPSPEPQILDDAEEVVQGSMPPAGEAEAARDDDAEDADELEELTLEGVRRGPHDFSMQAAGAPGVFVGDWDADGVWFYQAYKGSIADWALEHQRFGGPEFKPRRMTWIKPSFAWMLYRAGYGHKHNQERILKIKVPHLAVAQLLSRCRCKHGGGGSNGRVQWDPARDLFSGGAKGKEPREMGGRAIQIGLKGPFSEFYVRSVVEIQDVTELAHRVGEAHKAARTAIDALRPELPDERHYMPCCTDEVLVRLLMLPGAAPEKYKSRGKHARH